MTASVHHKDHRREYIIIFVILAVLTVLELFVPGAHVAYWMKASSLVLLAVAKATIVALFYMHLKEETRWLKFIAAIPISAAVYATVLILESVFR